MRRSVCNHKIDGAICNHFLTSEYITATGMGPTGVEGFLQPNTGYFVTDDLEESGVCTRLSR